MNSKKAKKLRSLLRKQGIDVTQAVYTDKRIVNQKRLAVSVQIVLDRECGRGIYKRFKERRIAHWRAAHA